MIRPTAIRAIARPSMMNASAFRQTTVSRYPAVKPEFQPHWGRFTKDSVTKWSMTMAYWGIGAGVAVTLFMSKVPVFQAAVLDKIPIIRQYFIDDTPDSDKPF